ncbi:hypothetical protein LPJ59_004670 [Coemansia sp. RSA 2399]|nr:hypothetical protein LPJ59_004670 [Coemansia sp. RSA 2399]
MIPRLNCDIKERICQIAHQDHAQKIGILPPLQGMQFSGTNFTLTHVDSEWRRIAMRYAWHTIYIDDCLPNAMFSEIQTKYGHYARKMYAAVRFRGIVSHYRRYCMTHENADLQPFCDLHRWPRLQELDITYTHKCAFPGLANYVEPRLGDIRKVTIRGRIPIDMRRAVMFLNSPKLEEIHVCAFLREDDPLSSIATHNDPILLMPVAENLSTIRLTMSVDIRVINAVLCAGRQQLRKVELIGLCPTQLVASGVTRAPYALSVARERCVWAALTVLSIKLCTHSLRGMPAHIYFEAADFPRLECLKITDCSSVVSDSEFPLDIVYGRSFSAKWPELRYLRLLALADADSLSISQNIPQLARIDIQSTQLLKQRCITTLRGVWNLLASSLPLDTVKVTCFGEEDNGSERSSMDTHADLEFSAVRDNHPLRLLVAPNVILTHQQITTIRRKCQRISEFSVSSGVDNGVASSCAKECSESIAQIRGVPYLASVAPPPYRRMLRIMNLWGGGE